MQQPPYGELKPGAVPQAADEEGYPQIDAAARCGAAAAAQRDVDIVPQPGGDV